jgi:hypothetical protein
VLYKDGYHKITRKYDPSGNLVEFACFGTAGQSVLRKDGIHKIVLKYDQRNRVLETASYGLGGERLQVFFYAANGRLLRRTTLIPPEPAAQPGQSVARVVTVFDKRGRAGEVLFCDKSGRPVLTRRGYSRYTQGYDDKGQPTRRTFFDLDEKPVSTHVVVVKVAPGGQAQRLGVKPGDILIRYDGRPVFQANLFIRGRQAESKTDPPRSLVVQRQDRLFILQVSPGLLGADFDDLAPPQAASKATAD